MLISLLVINLCEQAVTALKELPSSSCLFRVVIWAGAFQKSAEEKCSA